MTLDRYLSDTFGLRITHSQWAGTSKLPQFLRTSASFQLCRCRGIEFIAAFPKEDQNLPALKRIPLQASRHTELPIVLVSEDLDPRQRKALSAQGFAVVVPGKFAFLPFLGIAAQAEAERRMYGGRLTSRAQAALVTIIANPSISFSQELREVSRMSASSVCRALDELAQRGIIGRGKHGREVIFDYERDGGRLLRAVMPLLATPIAFTRYVVRDEALETLPDAGETALAARSMLAPPPITQKATSKSMAADLQLTEVLEGELPDADTVELQVWAYDPLVAGLGRIDDVSLAASLVGIGDERINSELDALFGEAGLWQ